MQTPLINDCCRAIESFVLRAFLICIGIQLLWFLIIVFGSDKVATIHGAMIGIEETRMEQFNYDVKLQYYLILNVFKLASFLLFGIPWLVLRFSNIFRDKGLEAEEK
ncbi:MAG: hypothetical protein VX269_03250 [Verrucomicrobiota bacterium]|nr:hypothetical protein [Verrucomicrobiota bacterium]